MTTDPMLFLAQSRSRELQASARRSALARLAACCSPSRLRSALRAVRTHRQTRAPLPCCG